MTKRNGSPKSQRTRAGRKDDPVMFKVSSLIEDANVWSDWLPASWIGPLSWVQMAALFPRNTSPETILEHLASLLEETKDAVEERLVKWAADAADDKAVLITYEGYRELFHDHLLEHYRSFLSALGGSEDLEWLRDRLIRSAAGAQSFVWFLLNGIATAQIEDKLDIDAISRKSRWLAELDFYEPAMLAGDEVVLQTFYTAFQVSFAGAAPLPDRPLPSSSPDDPITDSEEPYFSRLAAIERRQTRQRSCAYEFASKSIDLSSDIWCGSKQQNAWDHALDLAKVPQFGWQRQLAFMLRDVSLDEVVLRTERTLIEMADVTSRNVIEDVSAKGLQPHDVRFGVWFKWWREHFRHWHDPLRTQFEQLYVSQDAAFVADWMPRFESAVFANFLVQCCHGRVYENRFGIGERDERLSACELFAVDGVRPSYALDLHIITLRLWERFCNQNEIADYGGEMVFDFEVDGRVLLASEQPRRGIRT